MKKILIFCAIFMSFLILSPPLVMDVISVDLIEKSKIEDRTKGEVVKIQIISNSNLRNLINIECEILLKDWLKIENILVKRDDLNYFEKLENALFLLEEMNTIDQMDVESIAMSKNNVLSFSDSKLMASMTNNEPINQPLCVINFYGMGIGFLIGTHAIPGSVIGTDLCGIFSLLTEWSKINSYNTLKEIIKRTPSSNIDGKSWGWFAGFIGSIFRVLYPNTMAPFIWGLGLTAYVRWNANTNNIIYDLFTSLFENRLNPYVPNHLNQLLHEIH